MLATIVLSSAASLAKLFVYVRGPSFDDATDLRKLGFTRYYETWAANTCHFNSTHLMRAFRDIASRRRDAKWVVVLGQPLATSRHDAMLPLGMPGLQRQSGLGRFGSLRTKADHSCWLHRTRWRLQSDVRTRKRLSCWQRRQKSSNRRSRSRG